MAEFLYDDPQKILKPQDAWRLNFHDYMRSKRELIDPYRDKWEAYEMSYRSYVEELDDEVLSNYSRPLIYSHVESFLPRIVGSRPRIEAWGRERADELRAAIHRALIFYYWDLNNMPLFLVDFVKSAQIKGTAWGKVYHKKEVRIRPVRRKQLEQQFIEVFGELVPIGEEEVLKLVDTPVKVFDDPYVELLELDEVYPDPDMKNEDQNLPIIHRCVKSIDELESAMSGGEKLYDQKVVKQIKDRAMGSNPKAVQENETLWRKLRAEFGPEVAPTPSKYKREVHIVERWTHDKVITTCEEFPQLDPLLNKRNDYGMHPFFRYTPCPVPNDLYGIGKAEVLFSTWQEMNDLSNARMDHLAQTVHQMYSVKLNSPVNPMDLRWRPRGHFWVGDHDDIAPVKSSPIDFANYREQQNLEMIAQRATGGSDTFAGLRSDTTGATATEAQLLAQAAGSRAGLEFAILGMQSLSRLGRLFIRDSELYLEETRRIRILGDEVTRRIAEQQNIRTELQQAGAPPEGIEGMQDIEVTPEDLISHSGVDLDVTIDVASNEPETRAFKTQTAINAIQILGNFYAPTDPLMLRLRAQIAQGFGFEFVTELSSSVVPNPSQMQPPGSQGPTSPAEQLAVQASDQAPSTGDSQ